MATVSENFSEILNNKGNYIRFGGRGIIDGLKNAPTKNECYEIIREEKGSETQCSGLILRRFNCRNFSFLPFYEFNQEFDIIGKKGFKRLPKY
jgi:hypothetical protein